MPTCFFQSCLGPSFSQFAGEIFSVEVPSRLAPRHCGHSTALAKEWRKQDADTASQTSEGVLFMNVLEVGHALRGVNGAPCSEYAGIRLSDFTRRLTKLEGYRWSDLQQVINAWALFSP